MKRYESKTFNVDLNDIRALERNINVYGSSGYRLVQIVKIRKSLQVLVQKEILVGKPIEGEARDRLSEEVAGMREAIASSSVIKGWIDDHVRAKAKERDAKAVM